MIRFQIYFKVLFVTILILLSHRVTIKIVFKYFFFSFLLDFFAYQLDFSLFSIKSSANGHLVSELLAVSDTFLDTLLHMLVTLNKLKHMEFHVPHTLQITASKTFFTQIYFSFSD